MMRQIWLVGLQLVLSFTCVDWDDDFNMPEKTEESSSSSSYFNEIPSSTPPSTTDVKDDFSFMDELGGFSSPSPSHISGNCVRTETI